MANKSRGRRRIVKLTETPKNEAFKFGCASGWTGVHLTKLGVKFKRWDFDRILNRGGALSEEEQKRQSPFVFSLIGLVVNIGKDQLDMFEIHDLETKIVRSIEVVRQA